MTGTGPYRIVIAEDHTLLREGLKALVASDPTYEVVAEAENGSQAIQCVRIHKPDLLLIDVSMPQLNGIDALREIKRRHPKTRILVLTIHDSDDYLTAALRAGADGYILKDVGRQELLFAIHNVLKGKSYLSAGVSEKVIAGYLDNRTSGKISKWQLLTQREREILTCIAEGKKNREIAEHLFLSAKTVEKHRSNLMKKLNLHSTAELTAYAIEEGLKI